MEPFELYQLQAIEHAAWLALMHEMRKAGVGAINAGGKHERLHDAITAWGEELAQLRINDPNPAHAERALEERQEKYLGANDYDGIPADDYQGRAQS